MEVPTNVQSIAKAEKMDTSQLRDDFRRLKRLLFFSTPSLWLVDVESFSATGESRESTLASDVCRETTGCFSVLFAAPNDDAPMAAMKPRRCEST